MKGILFALLSALLTLGTHATFAAPQSGSVVEWGFEVLPAISTNTSFRFIAGGYQGAFAVSTSGLLYGWRWSGYGEIPPMNQVTNIVAVSAYTHTLALTANGTILAWGDDSEGGTNVPPGLTNVVAVSAMDGHSLALKADGTVAAWGDDFCGESDVPPGVSNIVAVAAGICDSYLLKSDGTVLYLGNDTNAIVSGLSNAVSIASGNYDLWAVESNGSLVHSDLSAPAVFSSEVLAGVSNIVAVSSGYGAGTLALQSDGTVWYLVNGVQSIFHGAKAVAAGEDVSAGLYALGTNGCVIQFGANFIPMQPAWGYTRSITTLPVGGDDLVPEQDGTVVCLDCNDAGQPANGWSNVAAIATGYGFNLALETNGTVLAAGDDSEGQTDVPTNLTDVAAIAAGGYHSLALLTNGSVVGWGYNEYGQADGWASGVAAISAGALHSLALMSNGTVQAVGDNDYGQCDVPPGLKNVMAMAAGGAHNLVLQSNGTIMAWGYNEAGQCNVPVGLSNVVAIAAGGDHSLALTAVGTVVAWGDNTAGESTVPSGLGPVIAISAGETDSMALVLPQLPTLQAQRSGGALLVSWPTNYPNLTLQMANSLNPPNWLDCPNLSAIANGQFIVTNFLSSTNQFFRLRN